MCTPAARLIGEYGPLRKSRILQRDDARPIAHAKQPALQQIPEIELIKHRV